MEQSVDQRSTSIPEIIKICRFEIKCSKAAFQPFSKNRSGLENGPFDLDLIFAPDGIERFEDAWNRRVEVEGFPVCHLDDIIASKEATGRQKDRDSLPRLKSFRDYRRKKNET
jgi:hypothetical protein